MLAAVTNLIAYQGADFTNTFYVTNDNGSSFDFDYDRRQACSATTAEGGPLNFS